MEMFIPASNATGKYVIDGKVAVLVLDPYDPAAYRLVILDSDWLTQVILISDWLTQVILISDWLISCCLQNWVHQHHCPRQGSADNLGGGRQAETGHRGGPRDGDQCGGSQHQDGQPVQRSGRCFGQGKFLPLIGWHRAILISDWLFQTVDKFLNQNTDKFIKDFQPAIAKSVSGFLKKFYNSAVANIDVSVFNE